jgi:hypothetical protein
MATKIIKSGKKEPNTVEIIPSLTFAATFDEKTLKNAGFKVLEVSLKVDKSRSTTSSKSAVVCGIKIMWHKETRERYSTIRIEKDFNKVLKALRKYDSTVSWPIATVKVMNNRSKKVLEFKSVGQRVHKKMILKAIDGVPYINYDLDDIMKEVSNLFYNQCFYKVGHSPIICDI